MKAKFELFKGKNLQWYFRLKSSNGQIVAQSEGYTRRGNALKGIAAVRKYAGKAKLQELD